MIVRKSHEQAGQLTLQSADPTMASATSTLAYNLTVDIHTVLTAIFQVNLGQKWLPRFFFSTVIKS